MTSLKNPQFAAYELSSSGSGQNSIGAVLGRFHFNPGTEREECPVYKQAHSTEVPSDKDYLLYRSIQIPLTINAIRDMLKDGM